MLDPYIGESMLSIIDINYGIKEPTHGIQYCIPGQIWIFGGYLKARESLYTELLFGSLHSRPY